MKELLIYVTAKHKHVLQRRMLGMRKVDIY